MNQLVLSLSLTELVLLNLPWLNSAVQGTQTALCTCYELLVVMITALVRVLYTSAVWTSCVLGAVFSHVLTTCTLLLQLLWQWTVILIIDSMDYIDALVALCGEALLIFRECTVILWLTIVSFLSISIKALLMFLHYSFLIVTFLGYHIVQAMWSVAITVVWKMAESSYSLITGIAIFMREFAVSALQLFSIGQFINTSLKNSAVSAYSYIPVFNFSNVIHYKVALRSTVTNLISPTILLVMVVCVLALIFVYCKLSLKMNTSKRDTNHTVRQQQTPRHIHSYSNSSVYRSRAAGTRSSCPSTFSLSTRSTSRRTSSSVTSSSPHGSSTQTITCSKTSSNQSSSGGAYSTPVSTWTRTLKTNKRSHTSPKHGRSVVNSLHGSHNSTTAPCTLYPSNQNSHSTRLRPTPSSSSANSSLKRNVLSRRSGFVSSRNTSCFQTGAHYFHLETDGTTSQSSTGTSSYLTNHTTTATAVEKTTTQTIKTRTSPTKKLHTIVYPAHWEHQTDKFVLIAVDCRSTEWDEIGALFGRTMSGSPVIVQVQGIHRIQNQWLWEKYAFSKERMSEKNNGVVNERQLFHGTGRTPPEDIFKSEHGFDFRYASQGMWGTGTYFAVNASYSDRYAYSSTTSRKYSYTHSYGRSHQMILANVLTGLSCQCRPDRSLTKPPVVDQSHHSNSDSSDTFMNKRRYDSVSGHTGGSDIVVIYDHDKAYPAYLITYH